MKVIINASGYVGQSGGAGGAGVFLQYLVSRLAQSCQVDVLVKPNSTAFRNLQKTARLIELPYLTAETLNYLRSGPTVVLDPFGGLPCGPFPDDLALCIVIHDLMHLESPHYFTESERKGRSISFAGGFRRADGVIAFSADQARAIRRYFPGAHPTVIPHLPYMTLQPPAADGAAGALTGDLSPYVIFPGVKWPHKNHKTVTEAFAAYIRRTNSSLKLVICGGPCAENRFSFYPPVETMNQVVDLGMVSDDVLRALYSGAEAILFPTLYEGFGIPVLEAAYLGKMVVATGLAVFDEILGASNYLRVAQPLCNVRWMEAFAEIEGPARPIFEERAKEVRRRVDVVSFIESFTGVLTKCAERYTHPALYPLREFVNGDRLGSTRLTALTFNDLYGGSTSDKGSRHAVLGPKPSTQSSSIFRSAEASPDKRVCLRAQFEVAPKAGDHPGSLQFSAWVRLHGESNLDQLNWSANDLGLMDLLPKLKDGDWHLIRAAVPHSGFVDFRAVRAGTSEVAGFDIEIHDPTIVRLADIAAPLEKPSPTNLTVVVAALAPGAKLGDVGQAIGAIDSAIPGAQSGMQWIVIVRDAALDEQLTAADLAANVDVHVVGPEPYSREAASGLLSPYRPVSRLLLLESESLASCLDPTNIQLLTAASSFAPLRGDAELTLNPVEHGYWLDEERGRVISGLESRTGQPMPLLDPVIIQTQLNKPQARQLTRFVVIETDVTSNISHHGTVTGLFLDGAKDLGFEPIRGLHKSVPSGLVDDVEVWGGFSAQVYTVGTADAFADELAQFIEYVGLGRDDVIFMHSLAPAIVLGAARYIAANPATAPNFAMRFFSTAEAMSGHKLSYTKILKSIESVRAVRRKMHFFCESRNLERYYQEEVGSSYPLLFNPEHPSLAMVRDSGWLDPALSAGNSPTLAYFGEAREEKGFDDVPGMLASLLESQSMSNFQFLIQTGSNAGNDTPKMARAKEALLALKAKHPNRVRTFQSVETPEQFYFLMKHAVGILAPYKPASYGKRGTGVILEALQMGLEVFAWEDTDLYATFKETGRVVGVRQGQSFASGVIDHYSKPAQIVQSEMEPPISLNPVSVCERLLSYCFADSASQIAPSSNPVLWVGNDTFGEGCSAVYSSQKRALGELGLDCYELFVPWPDPNWAQVESSAWDAKIYGFESGYESKGLAWVAMPAYNQALLSILEGVRRDGPTYRRLRLLNEHFSIPPTLKQAIANGGLHHTILNYSHLYPVIAETVPVDEIVCETHDIIAYQNAVRRDGPVSLVEKLDEFSDLGHFRKIIAISADEQREISGACTASTVYWKLPPYMPESLPPEIQQTGAADVRDLIELGGVPDEVVQPSVHMLSAYYARKDLQSIFRLDTPSGRVAFFRWWFLFGQFETASGLELTQRQLEWIIGRSEDGGAGELDGALRLMLSFREDLRRSFCSGSKINMKGLVAWSKKNMQREFGISKDQLTQYEKIRLADPKPKRAPGINLALAAVLDCDPTTLRQRPKDVRQIFERIADVERVDMVMVGSNHPANVKTFKWFIDKVFMEYFADRERNLFVVGSVCNELADSVDPRIFLLGRCTRIEPLLKVARACPLPVMFGSGSPIKTIPAIAVNGAVSVSNHVDRAFALGEYGIPSFHEPREFADDLWALLSDDAFRNQRQTRARNYFQDKLTLAGYAQFWKSLLP